MDLIDKRDEVLRIFLEYGITENIENSVTKKDLANCAEEIVKHLHSGESLKPSYCYAVNKEKNKCIIQCQECLRRQKRLMH